MAGPAHPIITAHLINFSSMMPGIVTAFGSLLKAILPLLIVIVLCIVGVRYLRRALRGKPPGSLGYELEPYLWSAEEHAQNEEFQGDWDNANRENARWERKHPYEGSIYEETTSGGTAGRSIYEQDTDENGGSIYES